MSRLQPMVPKITGRGRGGEGRGGEGDGWMDGCCKVLEKGGGHPDACRN